MTEKQDRKHQPFEYDGAETDEICRLRRVVEAQEEALMHWRRQADMDAGKIARLQALLESCLVKKPGGESE